MTDVGRPACSYSLGTSAKTLRSSLQVGSASMLQAVKVSPLIETVSDHKDFKKLLRTRTNVLILYTKSG